MFGVLVMWGFNRFSHTLLVFMIALSLYDRGFDPSRCTPNSSLPFHDKEEEKFSDKFFIYFNSCITTYMPCLYFTINDN